MRKRARKFYASYPNQEIVSFLISIKELKNGKDDFDSEMLSNYLGLFLSNKLKRSNKYNELLYYLGENKTDYAIVEFNDRFINIKTDVVDLKDLDLCIDGYEISVLLKDSSVIEMGCFYDQNFYIKQVDNNEFNNIKTRFITNRIINNNIKDIVNTYTR